MYKIINITDRNGIIKQSPIDELKLTHPNLLGDFIYYDYMMSSIINGSESRCCFEWADDSGKMLRTSPVKSVSECDGIIEVVTMNSVYTFEKVEEK